MTAQQIKTTDTEKYEAWNEDGTPFRHVLRLDADSYRADSVFDIPCSLARVRGIRS